MSIIRDGWKISEEKLKRLNGQLGYYAQHDRRGGPSLRALRAFCTSICSKRQKRIKRVRATAPAMRDPKAGACFNANYMVNVPDECRLYLLEWIIHIGRGIPCLTPIGRPVRSFKCDAAGRAELGLGMYEPATGAWAQAKHVAQTRNKHNNVQDPA